MAVRALPDRRSAVGLAAAVLLAAALRLPGLLTPLHDYDEGVYWASLRSLDRGHALYAQVYSSQPPGFLLGVWPAFALGGHGLVGARAGVLLLSLLGVAAGGVAASALAGRRAGLAAALLLAVDPLLLRQGSILQAEAPAAGLALAAVAAAALGRRRMEDRRTPIDPALAGATLAGALAALAILTKVLELAAVAPVAILLAVPRRGAAARLGAALGGGVLAAVALLGPVVAAGDGRALLDQTVGLHLASHAIDEGGLAECAGAILRELPLAGLAILGALLAWRDPPLRLAVVAAGSWVAAGLVELPFQHPLWPHHLVAVAPGLCLVAAIGAGATGRLGRRTRRGAGALAAGAGIAAAAGLALLVRDAGAQTATPEQRGRLAAALAPGTEIVTDDQAAAAASDLEVPAELVDTSLVRVLTGDVTTARVEAIAEGEHVAAVCYLTTRLDHLDGLRPWVRAHFPREIDLGGGAVLYLRR